MSTKKIVAAIAVAIGCLGQAQATPAYFDEHKLLVAAVESTGLKVLLNTHECIKGVDGMFQPTKRRVIICQDHGTPGGTEVGWTQDDLFTLRHEAHHVTQGCMIGSKHDSQLDLVYANAYELVRRTIPRNTALSIIETYEQAGMSKEVIRLELEAFAVAALSDPLEQVQDIKRYCF